MTASTPATKEVKVNYTAAMVARMKELAPLDLAKAELLAAEFGDGKTAKSVIAKAKREQIEYRAKEPVLKKGKDAPTKAQLVAALKQHTGLKLDQLDKAPTLAIVELIRYISEKVPMLPAVETPVPESTE